MSSISCSAFRSLCGVANLRHSPLPTSQLSTLIAPACVKTAKEPLLMARRLFVPLAGLGLVFGSLIMAAGAASAATPAPLFTHPSVAHGSFVPGGLMTRPTSGNHIATVGGPRTA